jgi:hypothetical protein
MFISFELSSEPMTYQQLNSRLIENKIPYPVTFTAVAVYESGWKFQSTLANTHNNLFGFICITPVCYKGYSTWNTKRDCINYLSRWVNIDPPIKNETGISFLKRRNYNPYPSYYVTLKGIEQKLQREFYCD